MDVECNTHGYDSKAFGKKYTKAENKVTLFF